MCLYFYLSYVYMPTILTSEKFCHRFLFRFGNLTTVAKYVWRLDILGNL